MMDEIQLTQVVRQWTDVFATRSMHDWSRYVKSTGLSMPQFSILMQLHYKGACGMSEISERFDVSAAAASQLVDKLVQAGYIERTEDPSDRLAKLLKLSTNGSKLVDDGIQERYRWMDELTTKLSAAEQTQISAALAILTEAARQMDQQKTA